MSAGTKLRHPLAFGRTVAAYHILPMWAAKPAGLAIVAIEAALAGGLLTGFGAQWALPFAAILMLAFAFGVAVNLSRGRHISCGCFGGAHELISARSLLRLALLLMLVCIASIANPGHRIGLFSSGPSVGLIVLAGSVGLLTIGLWFVNLRELRAALRSAWSRT